MKKPVSAGWSMPVRHPAILEVAVYGIAHPEKGELILGHGGDSSVFVVRQNDGVKRKNEFFIISQ